MTASSFTASSTASWRRPATSNSASRGKSFNPARAGMGGSDKPDLKAEFSNMNHCARHLLDGARAEPEFANSQFFICFDDSAFLNRQYTVWGQVVEGMDNVDKIKRGEPVHGSRQDRLDEGRRGHQGMKRQLVAASFCWRSPRRPGRPSGSSARRKAMRLPSVSWSAWST